jgi:hypothetical protein
MGESVFHAFRPTRTDLDLIEGDGSSCRSFGAKSREFTLDGQCSMPRGAELAKKVKVGG